MLKKMWAVLYTHPMLGPKRLMVWSEALNALTMVPGIFLAMQHLNRTTAATERVAIGSYVWVCAHSMFYHLVDGEAAPRLKSFALGLDLLTQQLSAVLSFRAFKAKYGVHHTTLVEVGMLVASAAVLRSALCVRRRMSGADIVVQSAVVLAGSWADLHPVWLIAFFARVVSSSSKHRLFFSHSVFHIAVHVAFHRLFGRLRRP